MTQEIKNKLTELLSVARDISYELWKLTEDERITSDERDRLERSAIDADNIATNLSTF